MQHIILYYTIITIKLVSRVKLNKDRKRSEGK